MRKLKNISIFLLFATSFQLSAQIKITSKSVPVIGTSVKMINTKDNQIDIGHSGQDLLWDFSYLRGGTIETTNYKKQSLKDPIEADYKAIIGDEVHYYKIDAVGINETARNGKDPLLEIAALVKFKNYNLVKPFNLYFENYFNFFYDYDLIIPATEIPDYIKANIPPIKDSIKITVNVITEMQVDAWGKLILQKGHYSDVLRIKKDNIYNASIFIRSNNKWIEVDLTGLKLINQKLTDVKTRNYYFYNSSSREAIVEIESNVENDIKNIKYKDIDSDILIPTDGSEKTDIYLYPNPNFGIFKSVFLNVDPGTYTVKISNILGKKIWETNYKIDKSGVFKENLSYLSKGPYLYSITGPDGERILTRKMTVMKP